MERGVMSEEDAYNELCAHTWSRSGEPDFIHQLVVDAFGAQHANEQTKAIGLTFALIGLYLAVEKQYTGREVQRVHVRLGRSKRAWPTFSLPAERGSVTALQVLAAAPGHDRDQAIHSWCASVWGAYAGSREQVVELLRDHGIL